MANLKTVILFGALIAIVAGRDVTKCETDNNVSEQDWKHWMGGHFDAQNMQCCFKCIYQNEGILSSEGTLDAEKLMEYVKKWSKVSDAAHTEIIECLKKVGPVKECADIKHAQICVHGGLTKHPAE